MHFICSINCPDTLFKGLPVCLALLSSILLLQLSHSSPSLPRTFPVLFHSTTCLLATQSKASLLLQPTTPHILPPLASLNPLPLSESILIASIPSLESNNRLSSPVTSLSLCFSFRLHQLMTARPVYVKQLRTSSYVFLFLLVYLCTCDKHWSQPEPGTQRWSTKNTKTKQKQN